MHNLIVQNFIKMMNDFHVFEAKSGARLSFNNLPTSKIGSAPIGCIYSPLKQLQDEQYCEYGPVLCSNCNAIMNPFCEVDFVNKRWKCSICGQSSSLPSSYHRITSELLQKELIKDYSTMDYGDNQCLEDNHKKVVVFLIDLCASEKEFNELKKIVSNLLNILDNDYYVGLITFGNGVYVNQLCIDEFQRSFGFGGSRCYSTEEIQNFLDISSKNNKIFMKKKDAINVLEMIIDSLEPDSFNVKPGKRALRCTGVALDISLSLIELLFNKCYTQILLFTSGPITKGPGSIASINISDRIRTQKDNQNKDTMLNNSHKFFSDLSIKAVKNNAVINYVSASFEETGLSEIFDVIYSSGGFLMSCETYFDENILKSLTKYFKDCILQDSASNCIITLNLPKFLSVCGCIGPCISTLNKTENVSKTEIGCGGTIQWKTSGIIEKNSYTFIFDINSIPIPNNTFSCFQIVTKYRSFKTGRIRYRVTTIPITFYNLSTNKQEIINGFDQEAAAAILAKITIYNKTKMRSNVINELDQKLIDICHKFGDYKSKVPNTFSLQDQFKYLPEFIYYFRRSQFLTTSNITLDQYTSYIYELLYGDVASILLMIHPSLIMYSVVEQPKPVILGLSSLNSESILLLDSYFKVLIWNGKNVVQWKNNGYQDKPEYENLKTFLEQPLADAQTILMQRFPLPYLVICNEDSSESRYLLSKCNPPITVPFGKSKLKPEEQTYGDFYDTLKKLSVK